MMVQVRRALPWQAGEQDACRVLSGVDAAAQCWLRTPGQGGELPEIARRIERPIAPQDILSTMYHQLGINQTKEYVNEAQRPVPILNYGEPIKEIIA